MPIMPFFNATYKIKSKRMLLIQPSMSHHGNQRGIQNHAMRIVADVTCSTIHESSKVVAWKPPGHTKPCNEDRILEEDTTLRKPIPSHFDCQSAMIYSPNLRFTQHGNYII